MSISHDSGEPCGKRRLPPGLFLAAALTVAVLAIVCAAVIADSDTSSATVYNGTCGDNLNWEYNDENGALTITGSGAMNNYNPYPPMAPWSSYKEGIRTISLPNGLTTIGTNSFSGCKLVTEVEIPNTVTSIGGNAFSGCIRITSLTIPDSVISIGGYAFQTCSNLYSLTLGSSVTTIIDSAFSNCYSLVEIFNRSSLTLEKGSSSYGNVAKYAVILSNTSGESAVRIQDDFGYLVIDGVPHVLGYIGAAEALVFPDSIEGKDYNINANSFRDRTFTSVTFGSGVKTIGDSAFWRCSYITTLTIPDTLTSLGAGAFQSCSGLTSVNLGNGVVSIGDSAFNGCSKLTSFTIPASVTSIGASVFGGCSALQAFSVNGSNANYSSQDGVLFDKERTELIRYPAAKTNTSYTVPSTVTAIDSSAFNYNSKLTSLTIPDSVTSIGGSAFSGCTVLATVNMGAGVDSIGTNAFSNCTALEQFTVSSDNQSYSSDDGVLFDKGKTALIIYPAKKTAASYAIPATVTSIGNYAFYKNTSLTSVNLPVSVTEIGTYAFANCSNLATVSPGGGVTTIHDRAFYGCSNLESFPTGSVVTFGGYVFYECSKFGSSDLSSAVTLGESAFYGCREITSIVIPDSVTSMGHYVFNDCRKATSISIGKGVTILNQNVFGSCNQVTSVTIPDNVETININAFINCTGLSEIYIGNGTTTIYGDAFKLCTGITQVYIGTGLTTLLYTSSNPFSAVTLYSYDGSETVDQTVDNLKGTLFVKKDSKLCIASKGVCGDDMTWAYDYATDTLSINGSGDMTDYATGEGTHAPWERYKTTAKALTATGGITSIGDYAFYEFAVLASVTLPGTVTTYGTDAFYGTTALDSFGIESGTASAVISASYIEIVKQKAAADPSSTLSVDLSEGTVTFDSKAIESLSQGSELKMESVDKGTLDDATKKIVGDNPVYEITFGANTNFGDGKATFTVPYTLPEGKSADKLKAFCIKDGAVVETIDCTYADGKATFGTNHLSMYSIGFEDSSDDGNKFPIWIVAVIAVVVVAAAGGAFFLVKKKKA